MGTDRPEVDVVTWGASDGDVCGGMGTDGREVDMGDIRDGVMYGDKGNVGTWGRGDKGMGTDGHEVDVVTWGYGDIRGGDGCGDMGTDRHEVDVGDIRDGVVYGDMGTYGDRQT